MRGVHPLATIFPMMNETAFAELKADIATYGLHEAVWLYEDKILDGRNRWRACDELGITCPTIIYEGDDPLALIMMI
jgi:ParB-like chromosome segregation protein Spo0J